MEQNLGGMIARQRAGDFPVEELVELLMDPHTNNPDGSVANSLTAEEHVQSLALCVAILVRRLARVDLR